EVAPVAHGAHAAARLAGQDRADLHLLEARLRRRSEAARPARVDQLAGFDQLLVRDRMDDVLGRGPAQHAVAERLDDFLAVLVRADPQPPAGGAGALAD